MTTFYKVNEFAELSGVTVKALHHYDRMGLLKPRRSATGYRIYTEPDMNRLEQIVALKFIGLSLQQIKDVLDRGSIELPDALRLQRQILEEKQRLLARAISAIVDAEKAIRPGESTDPAVLKRLIEVINMQDKWDLVNQYWSDEARAKHAEMLKKLGVDRVEEWKGLRRDIATAIGEDPAGAKAQALGGRLMELMKRDPDIFNFSEDPDFLAGGERFVADRQNWPTGVDSRIEETNLRQMVPFILNIMAANPDED